MKTIPKEFIEGSIQDRQKAFLEDTIKYFNSLNRCEKERENSKSALCIYSAIDEVKTGCAIGRWLEPDLAKSLDDSEGYSTAVDDYLIFNSLPEWMRNLDQKFLFEVQRLHDSSNFWNNSGISSDGETQANLIREKFGL